MARSGRAAAPRRAPAAPAERGSAAVSSGARGIGVRGSRWAAAPAVVCLLGMLALGAWAGAGPAAGTDVTPAAAFGGSASARFPDPFPPTALVSAVGSAATGERGCPALLDFRMEDLRGRRIDLCAFSGKVLLLVNTASFCGFTHQYRGLEALQERYGSAGLVVIGFPSNDFGAQEPGSNAQIQDFCEATYGVRFPMLGKVNVRGPAKAPIFARLTALPTPQSPPGEIAWNFEKFLLDREGRLIARFRSTVEPDSAELLRLVQQALQAS